MAASRPDPAASRPDPAASRPDSAASPIPEPAGPRRLRLGTRGSALAVAQSTMVADQLRALGADVDLVIIRTAGDDRAPDTTWGEGAFVGALEVALLEERVDLAVHSAKDVPTLEDARLVVAAYPRREDARDTLVAREPGATLATLPAGARVGTDSPRRTAFLAAVRPDLRFHPLHGNVDTRLRRLDDGETDALVLACAGLTRLGRADRIGERLPPTLVPPAPGQGALALQCRTADEATRAWLARLDDVQTRAAVEAERAFLAATGGGCRAPIGALAEIVGGRLRLTGATAGREDVRRDADGRPVIAWGTTDGEPADRLRLARDLAISLTVRLAEGNVDPGSPAPAGVPGPARRPRVLVTRPDAHAGAFVTALARVGLEPVVIPTIEIEAVSAGGELDAAILAWPDQVPADQARPWIVITSANGASAVLDAARRLGVDLAGARWAAVGDATRVALEARGVRVAFTPSQADGERLAAELPLAPGTAVLLPRADIADGRMVDVLHRRGARVSAVAAYRTVPGPAASRERLRALFATGGPDAIVLTSGSTLEGLLALLGSAHREAAQGALAICIGPRTGEVARLEGFRRVAVSPSPDPHAVAALAAERLGVAAPMEAAR